MELDPDTLELAEAYDAETHLGLHVCAALIEAGIEPSARHTRAGFSAREGKILAAHYDKHDPHGSRKQNAEIDAELG